MDELGKIILTLFGGVITVAIVASIVSKKSQAPQFIQAAGSALANVVAAAVQPIQNPSPHGNLGTNAFSTMIGGLPFGENTFMPGNMPSGAYLNLGQ